MAIISTPSQQSVCVGEKCVFYKRGAPCALERAVDRGRALRRVTQTRPEGISSEEVLGMPAEEREVICSQNQ